MALCANIAALLALLLAPYMPQTSKRIRDQLKLGRCILEKDELCFYLAQDHIIGEPSPLFRRIDVPEIQKLQQKFSGEPEKKPASKKSVKKQSKQPKKDANQKAKNEKNENASASNNGDNSNVVSGDKCHQIVQDNKPDELESAV